MSDSSNRLSCKLNSSCDCVHILSSLVAVMAQRAGLSDKQANRMILAVDELFANIAEHGYRGLEGQVDMSADWQGGALRFELRDYAPPLSEDAVQGWPAKRADGEVTPGGLGMNLMRAVMDRVEHQALPDGNRWVLTKFLDGEQGDEA